MKLTRFLPNIELQRVGTDDEAGLLLASLPWPKEEAREVSLGDQPTVSFPLGQWPATGTKAPRRLLLMADSDGAAPETLKLGDSTETISPEISMGVEAELFERSPYPMYIWERHLLRIRHGKRNIGLVMGLRHGGEVHWWEACRLVILEETPEYIAFEMGGAIPVQVMTYEEFESYVGYANPYLHKHNWLNGRIYGRLHANGVCEIYAHHVNSKFFDEGGDFEDCVPVLGIDIEGQAEFQELDSVWDGSQRELKVDGAKLDLTEVARLATEEKPGRLNVEGRFLVLQPYEGMELFGGACPTQLLGDPYILKSEHKKVLRGMSRTLPFSLSLSDRSPKIARYIAPSWWYGLCAELTPNSLLPVSNEYDVSLEQCRDWLFRGVEQGGFEDGSLPRFIAKERAEDPRAKCEPGWEGEIPYGALTQAYRSEDGELYSLALRSCRYFTDVSVDHAAKSVRMHGYPPPGFSVPMNRMQAAVGYWLETGDPLAIETAQSVILNSHAIHKNSWPRMAMGRDASYVRSAVLLYRFLGDEYFRKIALDGALNSVEVQREEGSFGDQGGGSGIHMWAAYITKPWMGLLGLGGALDYLDAVGPEPKLEQAVLKFGDWLMAERIEREVQSGWSYQHSFDGGRKFYTPHSKEWQELPSPEPWHQDSLARLLGYCTFLTGDEKYLAAWVPSRPENAATSDHAVSCTLQFLPWLQDRLLGAVMTPDGIALDPKDFGVDTPKSAVISTPTGQVEVLWTADGEVRVTSGQLETASA